MALSAAKKPRLDDTAGTSKSDLQAQVAKLTYGRLKSNTQSPILESRRIKKAAGQVIMADEYNSQTDPNYEDGYEPKWETVLVKTFEVSTKLISGQRA
ncbi:MAG: hypothetical protein Q9226_002372 [Calogaya cf. arnoldii]